MKIIPIKELQNTSKISEMAWSSHEPIFITKNGYGDMVLMSQESYQIAIAKLSIDEMLRRSELSIQNGEPLVDGFEYLEQMREKYGF